MKPMTSADGQNTVSVDCGEDRVSVRVEDRASRAVVMDCGDGKAGVFLYGPGSVEAFSVSVEDGEGILCIKGVNYPLSALARLLEGAPPVVR